MKFLKSKKIFTTSPIFVTLAYMGSAFAKFVECDYCNTYCPKCQTTCDQCGRPVTPFLQEPVERVQYKNGTIILADCYNIGFCKVDVCNLPSSTSGKYLINVRCFDCDYRTKISGGNLTYQHFKERSEINLHFDVTKEERMVKKLEPLVNPKFVKKCCRNCLDSHVDMNDKLIYCLENIKRNDVTSLYKDHCLNHDNF